MVSNDLIMEVIVAMLGGDKAVMRNKSQDLIVIAAKAHLHWNNRDDKDWLRLPSAQEPTKAESPRLFQSLIAEMKL